MSKVILQCRIADGSKNNIFTASFLSNIKRNDAVYKKKLNLSLKDIEILMSPSMRINFEGYLLGKVNHLAAACILSKKKRKNIEPV